MVRKPFFKIIIQNILKRKHFRYESIPIGKLTPIIGNSLLYGSPTKKFSFDSSLLWHKASPHKKISLDSSLYNRSPKKISLYRTYDFKNARKHDGRQTCVKQPIQSKFATEQLSNWGEEIEEATFTDEVLKLN